MENYKKLHKNSRFQKGIYIIRNEGFLKFFKIFFLWFLYNLRLFSILFLKFFFYLFTKPSTFLGCRLNNFIQYKKKIFLFEPKVSIIIPFKDGLDVLEKCVSSILEKTSYTNYQIILVNNQSRNLETNLYLDKIIKNSMISVVNYNDIFNYSAINNFAMEKINTEYVLFLNNDTEIINKEWLTEMMQIIQDKDVGAVGALLLYPDNTIQHAGVAFFTYLFCGPFHVYRGESTMGKNSKRINSICEYTAVTAACLLTKKSLYLKVGGMDEVNLPISFNDVDYCLKLRQSGYKIVYTSDAKLFHYESYSRGYDFLDNQKRKRGEKEKDYLISKWKFFYPEELFLSICYYLGI